MKRPHPGLFLFGATALLALLAAACSSSASDGTLEPNATAPPHPTVPYREQRVVYVSDDLAVFTIKADGTARLRVIGGGRGSSGGGVQAQPLASIPGQQSSNPVYTWPTWAPDGEHVAISRAPGPTAGSISGLVVIQPPSLAESFVQETSPGAVNGVAPGTFHYAQWSLDGQHLLFIAPNDSGDALALFEASLDGGEADQITQSAPLYAVWSPDSSSMLVHRQETLFLRDADGMEDLKRPSVRYRVPAYSSDGSRIAYVATSAGLSR